MTFWDSMFSYGSDVVDKSVSELTGLEGEVLDQGATATATGVDDNWWSKALNQALPQIMKMSSVKAPRGNSVTSSAKPVSGSAGSAMQVPQVIGKAADSNPLEGINQWGNLF